MYPRGPHSLHCAPTPGLLRAGVSTPRAIPMLSTRRADLRDSAEALGGFPLVVRFSGGSGGAGIVRVDSLPALFSLCDYARSGGRVPELVEFRRNAESVRVVVIGSRAVAWTRGEIPDDDFRNAETEQPQDYGTDVPNDLGDLAVAACGAVSTRYAGVDLLVSSAGAEVLEANTPFYFGHFQENGVDVAGELVEALMQDAQDGIAG